MRAIAVILMIGVLFCFGCERSEELPESDTEVTDFMLSESWPDEPERIVSLAPNITELLFELGLGDRVVAVTRYCDWPPEAEDVPTIGGMLDPDYEAILGARPDVVVGVIDGADHQTVDKFDGAGVAYGFLQIDDLNTVSEGIDRLGAWFSIEKEAAALNKRFQNELKALEDRIGESTKLEAKKALLVFDRQPVVAAGPGSFGEDLLNLAGLENAVRGDIGAYPVLDMEKVLAANPAVIVDVTMGDGEDEVLDYWRRFESLEAVERGAVVHIDDPVMMRPGTRIPDAVDRLGRALEEL